MLSLAARAVLTGLAAQDAAAVAPCLLPAARRELRDAYVRAALARFYRGQAPSRAAQAMAGDLAARVPPGTAQADAIAAILSLNAGRLIGWRQILNIADGFSGGGRGMNLQEIAQKLQNS
jgi:hypothetical protein